ncbi:MAG: MFS transporter [Peptococcaceae bacterium]|jgi:sugar phosphate permease|nr:MFS transporter [Peptococcaceae bacterium]
MNSRRYRYWIPVVLFTGLLFSAINRTSISVGMPLIGKSLHLTPALAGAAFSAFFLGYVLMQIPGGYIVDRLGPRRTLVAALLWYAVSTALIGTVRSFGALWLVLFLSGAGAQAEIPAVMKTLANWFPLKERSRASGVVLSAIALGPGVMPIVMVYLMSRFGWSSAFFFLLFPCSVAALLVFLGIRDEPRETPWISAKEIGEIEAGKVAQQGKMDRPYRDVFGHGNLWVLAVIYFLFNIAFWGFIMWLPTYLITARHMTVIKMGFNASIPYLAGFAGSLSGGWLADRLAWPRGIIAVSYLLTGVSMLLAFQAVTPDMSVVFLTLAGFFMYMSYGPFWSLGMSLLPEKVTGVSAALINLAGNIGGFIAPLTIGLLVQTTKSFHTGFLFMILSLVLGAVLVAMVRLGPAESRA